MIQETKLLSTPIVKSNTMNLITGTADQVSFPTEIGGSVKLSVGIMDLFRIHIANWTDPTIRSRGLQAR